MRAALLALLACAPLGGQGLELLEPGLMQQLDAMKRQVDQEFRSADGSRPVATSATRSIYLPGYGAVFSIEVNLAPTGSLSPFRRSYAADEIQAINQRKRGGLEPLRRKMRQILVEHGAALTGLAPDLQVALAVTLFHFPWEDRTQLPSQIVIAARRGALAQEPILTTRHY